MRNQKGITLIALAVTVIVLAILAGVTINMVLGDEGIITQANLEKTNQQRESDIEEITMAVSAEDFRRSLNGERRGISQIRTELEKKYGAGNVDIDYVAATGNEMTVKIENNDNREYSVDSEGRVTVYSGSIPTQTPITTASSSPLPTTTLNNQITFVLDGVAYTVESGTTWGEFMSTCPNCGSSNMYSFDYYHYTYTCSTGCSWNFCIHENDYDACNPNGTYGEDKLCMLPDTVIVEGDYEWE